MAATRAAFCGLPGRQPFGFPGGLPVSERPFFPGGCLVFVWLSCFCGGFLVVQVAFCFRGAFCFHGAVCFSWGRRKRGPGKPRRSLAAASCLAGARQYIPSALCVPANKRWPGNREDRAANRCRLAAVWRANWGAAWG
ncbi:hypothetical protein METBIDRAFT_169908 [Metschnikowia bicuspidata var. bicuspidata NRRL YB-4993]|uniref:Uncharacterized protein n=1 Tax=Metschnikowia bicuspidata var. bicuspidata NRRL YB-4993 TaxID=869754 RepID=A0A1A0HA01_9ASCO|nr:hypothetical protein METBIDRAFT_169908 [Metschnikowia bicuspidata var. bicuspidata NRRL YB-4993]OBA20959.1 hypothetical protein METBIDRAFT_169908 [Metschnikowia bicuspidata var. bicuspidata NRRL YB-4993]